MHHLRLRRQRGAAALTVILVLLFAMTFVAAFANRNLFIEQRTSVNQYRTLQAFEAAEAGLEWATAMLNSGQAVDAQCLPSGGSGSQSFRERYLRFDASTVRHVPRTWNDGGTVASLQPMCVRGAEGWNCSCPSGGLPRLDGPSDDVPHPAFSVQFTSVEQSGVVRLLVTGCTNLGGPCLPGSGTRVDASMRVQVLLGLVPGLATAPAAPLTVAGSMQVGEAAIGLHNSDAASGGLAVLAGGTITAPRARVTTAAGGSSTLAWAEQDAALHALSADQLFVTFFGLDKTAWSQQPAVTRFVCEGSCGDSLSAVMRDGNSRLIWVDGDLLLDEPVVLGTHERPVIVVASGAVQLSSATVLHGVLHGSSLAWNSTAGGGAELRGAAISASSYQGNGAPDLIYDADVLAELKGNTGSFTRVPGSWRDF